MLRFRRYRVFLVVAFIILVLLFRVGKGSNWDPPPPLPQSAKGSGGKQETNIRPPRYLPPPGTVTSDESADTYRDATPDEPRQQPPKKAQNIEIPVLKEEYGYKDYALPPVAAPASSAKNKAPRPNNSGQSKLTSAGANAANAPGDFLGDGSVEDGISTHDYKRPSKVEQEPLAPTITVHWRKPPEFFPVPTESLIRLPTGKPKPMPAIQAVFPPESPSDKEIRERRLAKVKSEAERAWQGYKKYAWTHDEVRPVSRKARDPFCGWAATMVDSLDTLWIMGLKDEFDDAVKAVGDIDFTTTPHRTDIPVFETTIRYLGGLLGAYDVSGGHGGAYKVLLDKALELAEILMGVFDTPNRMPVLFYNWQPEFASQPHRASAHSSVAELGSMSLEFTRLAQLTGQDRFYDAIARITDAFEEWQNRGTALDGVFPQVVDASGCNRTALLLKTAEQMSEAAKEQTRLEADKGEGMVEPQGYKPKALAGSEEAVELGESLRSGTTGGAGADFGSSSLTEKRENAPDGAPDRARSTAAGTDAPKAADIPGLVDHEAHANSRGAPVAASGEIIEWDCPAQGLVSGGYGADSYSMGGSQDSMYEYLPKQYLLLGGLEPKYGTMHKRTVKGVKKHLLYRPMIEDESRDLLLSGKASSYRTELRLHYEVSHLTCFLGGMFALGGKIFGSDEDVEIGKKLADGCAWAYEVMPTGIMPELAAVLPCKSAEKCEWNQTAWYEALDPNPSWREREMAVYLDRHRRWEEDVRKINELAEEEKEAAKLAEAAAVELGEEDAELRPVNDTLPNEPTTVRLDVASAGATTHLGSVTDEVPSVHKRSAEDASDSILERNRKAMEINEMTQELDFDVPPSHRAGRNNDEAASNRSQTTPWKDKPRLPREPTRPQTHHEYVEQRLRSDRLPPGFVSLTDKRYILRYGVLALSSPPRLTSHALLTVRVSSPEAIESVWYMYRITGDPIWQEKGWRMFESVIAVTSVPDGHSAIRDVSKKKVAFLDNEESFWLAETLKYYYLLFAPPDTLSLDEWVLNTEAHPFRRPT